MELPWLDMYEVWQVLGSYLEPAGARETKVAKQLRGRAEAVDCLRRAAGHLRLDPEMGQAPTIAQYEQAQKELGLPLSRRQIETRWEGWDFAKFALTGERPVETPAQRSLRRASSGRRRGHEEYLLGVREWLKTKPASTTVPDYDGWAEHRNETSAERPVTFGEGVQRGLALSWGWVLRVADFEAELPEAQQRYLDEMTAESGPLRLIGVGGVALVYGVGRTYAGDLTRSEGFPPPVAVINRARVWYRKDVEAHHAGRRVRRRLGELQKRIVDSSEVARRLDIKPDVLIAGIHRRRKTVPQPAGAVGGRIFWLRTDFESWLAHRPKPRNRDAKDA